MKKRVISLVLAMALSMSMFMLVGCNDAEKKLQKQIDELNALLTEQAGKITELETSKTEQAGKIAELESSKAEQAGKIESLETENQALKEQVEDFEYERKVKEAVVFELSDSTEFERVYRDLKLLSSDDIKDISYYLFNKVIIDGVKVESYSPKTVVAEPTKVELLLYKKIFYNFKINSFKNNYCDCGSFEQAEPDIELKFLGNYNGFYVFNATTDYIPQVNGWGTYDIDLIDDVGNVIEKIQYVSGDGIRLYGFYF